MDPQLKSLAKKRAKKDVDVELESGEIHELRSPEAVKRFESKKQANENEDDRLGNAEGIDRHAIKDEDDLGDHSTMLKRKKFTMLQSLLGQFDSMDGK